MLIAAYKFIQALLFVAVGVGALRLLQKDAGDLLLRLAEHLHFNPEWRLVKFILGQASMLNDPLLERIGVAAFAYALLGILEGTGLYLEKAWGEYLTLGITASFLPLGDLRGAAQSDVDPVRPAGIECAGLSLSVLADYGARKAIGWRREFARRGEIVYIRFLFSYHESP
jgi:uncharacterized membrane protein (DUF2068 family)